MRVREGRHQDIWPIRALGYFGKENYAGFPVCVVNSGIALCWIGKEDFRIFGRFGLLLIFAKTIKLGFLCISS